MKGSRAGERQRERREIGEGESGRGKAKGEARDRRTRLRDDDICVDISSNYVLQLLLVLTIHILEIVALY